MIGAKCRRSVSNQPLLVGGQRYLGPLVTRGTLSKSTMLCCQKPSVYIRNSVNVYAPLSVYQSSPSHNVCFDSALVEAEGPWTNYVLNDKYLISWSMDLTAAGAAFRYERAKDDVVETLASNGPTTKDLYIMVRERNFSGLGL